MSYLLDTNIVSLIVKRNLQISQKIEDVQAQRKKHIFKGLTVVSNDSDLLRVEGLSLEDWMQL
jgi:predicted nucleic acid-binding protein